MSAYAEPGIQTDDVKEAKQYLEDAFEEGGRPVSESEIARHFGLDGEEVFMSFYSDPEIDVVISNGDEPSYRPRSARNIL